MKTWAGAWCDNLTLIFRSRLLLGKGGKESETANSSRKPQKRLTH
jgi:hypothetical protein